MTPAAVPAPAGPPDELLPDEPMCVDGTDDSGAVHPRPDLVRAAAPAATGERERDGRFVPEVAAVHAMYSSLWTDAPGIAGEFIARIEKAFAALRGDTTRLDETPIRWGVTMLDGGTRDDGWLVAALNRIRSMTGGFAHGSWESNLNAIADAALRSSRPAATGERERADLLAEWDEHGEAVAFVAIRNYAGSANAKHIADYATDWFRRWLATLGRDAPEPREGGAQWRT